jgi:hypothetical protein
LNSIIEENSLEGLSLLHMALGEVLEGDLYKFVLWGILSTFLSMLCWIHLGFALCWLHNCVHFPALGPLPEKNKLYSRLQPVY